MSGTKKLSLSAICAALSVCVLWLGSFLDVMDLSMAALASLLTLFIRVEVGARHALLLCCVTSLLSLLLLPVKTAALFYALFCGYYPVFKAATDRLPALPAWLIKLVLYNAVFWAYYLLAKFVLLLPDEEYTGWLLLALLGLANLAAVLYDFALGRLLVLYSIKLRPRFAKFLR